MLVECVAKSHCLFVYALKYIYTMYILINFVVVSCKYKLKKNLCFIDCCIFHICDR